MPILRALTASEKQRMYVDNSEHDMVTNLLSKQMSRQKCIGARVLECPQNKVEDRKLNKMLAQLEQERQRLETHLSAEKHIVRMDHQKFLDQIVGYLEPGFRFHKNGDAKLPVHFGKKPVTNVKTALAKSRDASPALNRAKSSMSASNLYLNEQIDALRRELRHLYHHSPVVVPMRSRAGSRFTFPLNRSAIPECPTRTEDDGKIDISAERFCRKSSKPNCVACKCNFHSTAALDAAESDRKTMNKNKQYITLPKDQFQMKPPPSAVPPVEPEHTMSLMQAEASPTLINNKSIHILLNRTMSGPPGNPISSAPPIRSSKPLVPSPLTHSEPHYSHHSAKPSFSAPPLKLPPSHLTAAPPAFARSSPPAFARSSSITRLPRCLPIAALARSSPTAVTPLTMPAHTTAATMPAHTTAATMPAHTTAARRCTSPVHPAIIKKVRKSFSSYSARTKHVGKPFKSIQVQEPFKLKVSSRSQQKSKAAAKAHLQIPPNKDIKTQLQRDEKRLRNKVNAFVETLPASKPAITNWRPTFQYPRSSCLPAPTSAMAMLGPEDYALTAPCITPKFTDDIDDSIAWSRVKLSKIARSRMMADVYLASETSHQESKSISAVTAASAAAAAESRLNASPDDDMARTFAELANCRYLRIPPSKLSKKDSEWGSMTAPLAGLSMSQIEGSPSRAQDVEE